MLIQLPVFVVLYGVIRGLTNTVQVHGKTVAQPRYISSHTHLYKNLIAAHGHMKAFGLDLADTLFTHHTPAGYIPYGAIIAVAIGLQYFQMRQLNSRNPAAAQANPQMQMMQRYMPLIFAIIYIRIAAGVNIYFVISSLCRIGIQEAIFRSGILDKPQAPREGVLPARGGGGGPRRTLMERLADAQQRALEQQKARQAGLQADMDTARGAGSKEAPKRPGGGTGKPAGPGAKQLGSGPTKRPTGNGKASTPDPATSGEPEKVGDNDTPAASGPKARGRRPGVRRAGPNRQARRATAQARTAEQDGRGAPTARRPGTARSRDPAGSGPPPLRSQASQKGSLMEWVETTGRTIEEAKDAALDQLGVDRPTPSSSWSRSPRWVCSGAPGRSPGPGTGPAHKPPAQADADPTPGGAALLGRAGRIEAPRQRQHGGCGGGRVELGGSGRR